MSRASCSPSGATTPSSPTTPPQRSQAEREHRHHAVVEQVIADSKAGALAHLPSGHFHANAAWLTLWAMAYNLLRAAGALTSPSTPRPPPPPCAAHLVHVPARIARSARRITLHLPHNWPWQHAWTHLFDTVHRPPEADRRPCPPRPPGPDRNRTRGKAGQTSGYHLPTHSHRPDTQPTKPSEDHLQSHVGGSRLRQVGALRGAGSAVTGMRRQSRPPLYGRAAAQGCRLADLGRGTITNVGPHVRITGSVNVLGAEDGWMPMSGGATAR